MNSLVQMPAIWAGAFILFLAVVLSVVLLPRQRERKQRLRNLATLLRVSDPNVRIQSLERAHALAPRDHSLLAKILRAELSVAPKGAPAPIAPEHAITVWFIRQVLALLADARGNVRTDAARVLRMVMRRDSSQQAPEKEDSGPLVPAVAAAVELAGGQVFSGGERTRHQTRVLAFAEMLEAGLRPLAVGLRQLEGVSEEALEPLTSALRDRSPRIRRSLCEVLAAMGGDRAIELLVMVLQDPNPELRSRAAQALGSLKALSALSQLTTLLRDPIAEVRAAAALALAEIGVESACGALIGALTNECRRNDGAEATRAAMIDAVARLSDGGRSELAGVLATLPRSVAYRVTAALERNGVIERWLNDPRTEEEGDSAISLLGITARLGVSRPFLEALESTEEKVRLRAAAALAHSHDAAALAAVAALLNDPEQRVRVEAVNSLAMLGQPVTLGPLARASADPDNFVRIAAIGALRKVLQQRSNWRTELLPSDFDMSAILAESERVLLLASMDAQESVRMEAAEAIALFGSSEAAEALVNLALGDDSHAVREAATEAVARSNSRHIRRLLAGALEDKDETRRSRAMMILGTIGGAEAGRYLFEALQDPSPQVRSAALLALSRPQVEVSTEALASGLRNPDSQVRAVVTARLGRERTPECVPSLVQALADPEEQVRVGALTALAGLGRAVRKHEGALSARLMDPSPRVREVAASTLKALRSAWEEAPESYELHFRGPLTPENAASLVEMAIGGEMDPLLQALDNVQSAQSVAAHLAGAGRGKINPLLSSLRQLDARDQQRAVSALSRALRQSGQADGYLVELKAVDPDVRLMAIEIAGLLVTAEAIAALLEVLERDPLPEVRSRAASLLAGIPGEVVRTALLHAQQEDPNEIVRLVAARALSRSESLSENQTIRSTGESPSEVDSVQSSPR